MALSPKAQEILVKAVELINMPNRWIKGAGYRSGPEGAHHYYCSLGALDKAARIVMSNRSEYSADAYNEARGAVAKTMSKLGYEDFDIAYWNDAPERTHADVKAAFCKTLKRELQEGASNDTRREG